MTNEELDAFLELLTAKGWSVELRESGGMKLSEAFSRRYPRIPQDYLKFLQRAISCVNAESNVWFICADDYNETTPSGFAWNEFELIGLAGLSEQESEQVRELWNRYLPFMLSVKGDYACLSLCLQGDAYGSVVDSYAPDVDGFTDIAPNFDEFVRLFSAALDGDSNEIPLEYV
jgi:SMI1 / KNR4 family (SUKH-1)